MAQKFHQYQGARELQEDIGKDHRSHPADLAPWEQLTPVGPGILPNRRFLGAFQAPRTPCKMKDIVVVMEREV